MRDFFQPYRCVVSHPSLYMNILHGLVQSFCASAAHWDAVNSHS